MVIRQALDTAAIFSANSIANDATRMRIRERYILARFPQFAAQRGDLTVPEIVLRYAHEMAEDGLTHRAAELMTLAIEENRGLRKVWLALIEFSFLQGDAHRLSELCTAFKREFPDATLEEFLLLDVLTEPEASIETVRAKLRHWASGATVASLADANGLRRDLLSH